MSIPGSGSPLLLATTAAAAADAGYVIPKSLRFSRDDTSALVKTPSSAGNRRTFTWSAWVKRSRLGIRQHLFNAGSNAASTDHTYIDFWEDDTLHMQSYSSNANIWRIKTTQVFRDCSSFYHIVWVFDTTQGTASNRNKLYINGSQVTDLSVTTYPSQNYEGGVNAVAPHAIGKYAQDFGPDHFDGYMADVQFVDGQALAPTDFGETRSSDGVWVPKEYNRTSVNDGTTWSNGKTGSDLSGYPATNGFDGTTSNFFYAAASQTTTFTFSPAITGTTFEIYALSGGLWPEITVNGTGIGTHNSAWVDVSSQAGGSLSTIACPGDSVRQSGFAAVRVDGEILIDDFNDSSGYGRNGFHLNFSDSSTNEALGFDSAPTTPDPDPKKGMDVVTYSGTGAVQNVGGLLFEPGLVWIKSRTSTNGHNIYDTVRGANKYLSSHLTAAEGTATNELNTFNPDGFNLGSAAGVNGSGNNYVAWTWRAGGPAVSNSDGTTTSQVSANTDYGFSIVTYTGGTSDATIGHGLGQTPKFYIVKARESTAYTDFWSVYHTSLGESAYIKLNETSAATTGSTIWNSTAPTSTVFSVDATSIANENNTDYVAYVWSEISGYSKFSSYTGDGTSTKKITTGFKPRFLLVKPSSSTGNWNIFDSERPANTQPITYSLQPNLSNAEYQSEPGITFNDDGFTLNSVNTNGVTYIYAAFADRPGNNWDVNNIVTNEGLTTSKTQFDVLTYTGDGQTTQSIDSLAFQPDFVWIKGRNAAAGHLLMDSVRGTGNKTLSTNGTGAEGSETYGQIQSFDSNGFTVEAGSTSAENSNYNNRTYVAWCWKAGGTAVSNTDGSITSSVSANPSGGFSVGTYTGTGTAGTIGTGLSGAKMVIIKNRSTSSTNWIVYHTLVDGSYDYLLLQTTDANGNSSLTSSLGNTFAVGTTADTNASGSNYVFYAFENVPGRQRLGTYYSNSSDPTVITGFKPRFLLTKKTSAGSWTLHDSQRNFDDDDNRTTLEANKSDAEETHANKQVKFLDNGFQLIGADMDTSDTNWIYLAIGDDEIGSDEDCVVDVPNAVTADAGATDTTGGYQRGNYSTWNPLFKTTGLSSNGTLTLTNGNLEAAAGGGSWTPAAGTIAATSGKWYAEFEVGSLGASNHVHVGISPPYSSFSGVTYHSTSQSGHFYGTDGQIWSTGSPTTGYTTSTTGDIIGVALDFTASTVTFYKNGVSIDSVSLNSNITSNGAVFAADLYPTGTVKANFGQMRFKYGLPSGYAALNTTALPAATIADGSTAMDVALYTGNGSSQSITGLEFGPDFVWTKRRDGTSSHGWFDIVRGATKWLGSNSQNSEQTYSDSLTSFDAEGFTLGADTVWNGINQSSQTYVAWCWDGGSSTVSNTDGSITSSVRANQSAGFSIVTASASSAGDTIGHGLNAAPSLIIAKRTGTTSHWPIYHSSIGANGFLYLNLTNGAGTGADFWNNSAPTSSVFTVGSDSGVTGGTTVFYCFAPVEGYSAFGTYAGNGSDDGTFVYTGFRVAWYLVKKTNAAGENWRIIDATRSPINVAEDRLLPNSTAAEGAQPNEVDFLSNGFKFRSTDGAYNGTGSTYIYAAFASNPFQANGGLAR